MLTKDKTQRLLDELSQEINELKEKRASLLEDENIMSEELRADPDGFYSDSIRVDMIANCLYQIEKCEKDIAKLEKKKAALEKSLNSTNKKR